MGRVFLYPPDNEQLKRTPDREKLVRETVRTEAAPRGKPELGRFPGGKIAPLSNIWNKGKMGQRCCYGMGESAQYPALVAFNKYVRGKVLGNCRLRDGELDGPKGLGNKMSAGNGQTGRKESLVRHGIRGIASQGEKRQGAKQQGVLPSTPHVQTAQEKKSENMRGWRDR